MSLFKIEGAAAQPVVTFSSEVDEYGDFVLRANGQIIAFIEHGSGTLELVAFETAISGLSLDKDGCIEVSTTF